MRAVPHPAVDIGELPRGARLPFNGRSVDGVVQFRFLHHLPRSAQKAAVAEACRVARRFVVFSFFHPCSAHNLMRRCKNLWRRRSATRHALTLGRLDKWCHLQGFVRRRTAADLPGLKDLWLVSFERLADVRPSPAKSPSKNSFAFGNTTRVARRRWGQETGIHRSTRTLYFHRA